MTPAGLTSRERECLSFQGCSLSPGCTLPPTVLCNGACKSFVKLSWGFGLGIPDANRIAFLPVQVNQLKEYLFENNFGNGQTDSLNFVIVRDLQRVGGREIGNERKRHFEGFIDKENGKGIK